MGAKGQRPSSYHVPIGPFRALIDEHLEKLGPWMTTGKKGQELTPEEKVCRLIWPTRKYVNVQRRLFEIRHEQSWLHFDVADQIVCGLEGAMAWHVNEELNQIWESVDLAALDKAKPCDRPQQSLEVAA